MIIFQVPSLFLPTASISSMKMIEGDLALAYLNKSLTLDAPTPTNISTKSDPDMKKKGTPASPAQAFNNRKRVKHKLIAKLLDYLLLLRGVFCLYLEGP